MNDKAIVILKGLHPPWNMGEVVLSRNFVNILMKLYDDIDVHSTVDDERGPLESSEDGLQLPVKYYHNEEELRSNLLRNLSAHLQADIHFINASLKSFHNIIRMARRIFLYQFAYNVFNDPKIIIHSIGALPLTYISKVRIITTALAPYNNLRRLFKRHYYYVPAPIDLPTYSRELMSADCAYNGLKVLYLGHGSYLRFPYDKILKAIFKLKKEGYDVKFNIYISKLGYVNYMKFVRDLRRIIEKLSLETLIKIHLENLSEYKKWQIISENSILLFPSLVSAAIDPPLVILEAMFMGKCVIATSVQSISYLLKEGRGIVIDQRDLEYNIYEALKFLDSNHEVFKEYCMRAKKWAERNHSMDLVYNRMKRVINEL